jgi:hypothetical protein
VSQYIKAGLPVRWDGAIDILAAEAWIHKNVGTRSRTKVRTESEPPKRTSAYRTFGNKAQACRLFRMTRGEFDRLVLEGMPVVSAPKNRGGEFVVDIEAVDNWLVARERQREEAARRRRAAEEARREENERILARMSEEQRRKLLPRWARG